MLQLSRIFWAICRLKAGPQELPKRYYLLISVILAGIIVDSFASSILIPKLSALDIINTVVIYNVILLAAIYFLLMLLGYAERAVQTVSALAGSGLFISLVLLPALLVMSSADGQDKSFVFFILIDNVWRMAVNTHIFRHALSIKLLMAIIVSLSYFLFSVLVAEFTLAG